MKSFYLFLAIFLLAGARHLSAQCPPPGFPQPGNTCNTAPVLCENLDGYCATINNNNTSQNFPGCPGWQLNNDEWFAFYAGSTSITIVVTPSNCSPGGQQGLQGGIYAACGPPWVAMDLQCSCTENPFTLSANNFVIGQIYYFVLDGCGGNVCNYSIDVVSGSTVGAPPADPGAVSGPVMPCAGTSSSYSIPPALGATIYNWTLNPASAGTVTGSGPNIGINWSNTASGPVQLCVTVANACYPNLTPSCYDITVIPKPTATLSGTGLLCAGSSTPVNLTVTFTGEGPWQFVYTRNGAPQPAIQTSDNPYTLMVTQPGTYALQSVSTVTGGCVGTVSGTTTINQVTINASTAVTNASCGQSNGAVNLTVSGGTTPYMFSWSGGETSEDLSNIPAGTYTVTVTDNNGCTQTQTATVLDNTVNINIQGNVQANTTCIGGNGSIDITVTPPGTYTYEWSNSVTTQDQSNLPAGTYTVTVTTGVSCTASAEFTVADQPNTPNLSATTVPSTCELDNGSINLSVSGGVSPFTFAWSGGQTTEDLSNIPAGSYTVTVTGANGCSSTADITVNNNNPPINLNGTVVPNTTCIGGNGSISLSITPPGSYTITWSTGINTQNQTSLPPGTYTVTVSAGGACTNTAEFTIDDNPNTPNVNPNVTPSTCDLNNGSISLSVSGGIAPYTYVWSTGPSSPSLTNIPAGSYELTVTGANGCSTVVSIEVPNNNPTININGNTLPSTTCNGNGNGSISISVSPSGTYTYTWSTGINTQNQTNLLPGTYTVTVSGGGSCTATEEFTIDDDPNPPNINPNITPSTCDLNNGSISLSVAGGVAPYTYAWSTGPTTQTLTNIPAGSYDVTVTGANGCSTSANIDVPNNNPAININGNVISNTTCNATSGNGSIAISVTPAGSYTYLWSTNASSQNINGLVPGTYTVTVNGGGACIETAEFTVPDDPNTPDLSFTQVDPTCGLSNGSINLSVFNGVPPYTYSWSSGQTTQDLNNVPADVYFVTVTGANGCTAVDAVGLNNEDIPVSVDGTVLPKTSCVQNNGSITLMLNPSNLSVLWSNSSTAKTLTNLAPGTYTVTVSAGGNCTQTAEFTVDDESETPYPDLEVTSATCGFSNGSINLSVSGGIPPYTYKWSTGLMTQDISNLPAGNYAVTVTTSVGCSEVAFISVPAEQVPIEIFGVVSDNYSCTQPNGFIDIDLFPTGNNYTYSWSNGKKTQDISDLPAGVYTVTVTYGTCSAVATYDVFDLSGPPNVSTSGTPAICGQSNGAATAVAGGGTSPYSYKWSNMASTATISNLVPGTYTVTVTDFFGCSATATASVINNNVVLNITGTTTPNTSCSMVNGAVDISVTPAGAYTYIWSTTATSQDLSNLASGTYSVTVSAGVGCTAAANFSVANNTSNPDISAAVTAAICGNSNGSINLGVSGATTPYSFAWSNMATSEDLNNILSGTYTVTVTAGNGCTADTTLSVANNSSTFALSGTTVAVTNCVTNNGAIDLTVTPAGPYTYLWSTTATTEDISGLPDGTYTVSVTETGTCTASATFFVSDGRTYPLTSQTLSPELCTLANGSIDLEVTGGATPYTFLWTGGKTSEDLSSLSAGTYTVTVTGANGCSATTSATLPDNSINFSLAGTTVPNGSCITNTGGIDLVVNPTTPGSGLSYTYQWSNTGAAEDLSAVPAGTYTVTVSAGGSCTNTASFNVANTALPPQLSESIAPALCGQNSGGINLTVSSSTTPYTFDWSNTADTEDISSVASGSYTVTVTGANGCSTIKTLDVPENVVSPDISGIPSPNTSCVSNDGSINLSVSPANLSYTFNWSGSQTSQNIGNLAPGTYTVTVNGGGACTNVASFIIDNVAEAPMLTDSIFAALCGQNSGGVNLSISGATTPYTFNWSTGALIEDLGSVVPGTYSVTVTGANGCTVIGAYTVPEDVVLPAITGSPTANTSCIINNGAIDLMVSPGTLMYTYAWSGGPTTANLTDLAPGNYTVTVNGGGSCISTATFTVNNDIKAVSLSGMLTDILCFGDKTGAIDVSVSGGTAPFQYQWSPVGTGNSEDLLGLVSGPYAVTVTDALGCTATQSYALKQPNSKLQLTCSQSSNVSFPGATDGAAAIDISGGVAPYQINWTPGSTQSGLAAGVFSINNLGVGSYDVTVTDANGCTSICAFTISIINCETKLGAMSNSLLALCGTGCLTANYNTLGQFLEPDDVLQFVLHEGSGAQIQNEIARSNQSGFCFDPANMNYGTTYYISAVAGNNDGSGNVNLSHFCTVVSTGTPIVFYEQPTAAAATPASLSCAVAQVSLSGSSDVVGSAFAWSTGNGTILGNPNQAQVQATSAGVYRLIINTNGCLDTVVVQVLDITNQPEAEILVNPSDVLDCTISQIVLSGDVKGTSDANTIWLSNGNVYAGGTTITIDVPGVYEFVILDTLSFCSDTALVEIDEDLAYPPLFLNPAGLLTCVNNVVNLSGGSPFPGIQFTWATINGTDTTFVGTGSSLSVTAPGVYFLMGEDPVNHCMNSVNIQVNADVTAPVANAGTPFKIACYGETASLDGSGSTGLAGLTFQWSTFDGQLVTGLNTATPQINEPGTYTLLVTNPGNGCTDSDQISITPDDPVATAKVDQPDCEGDKGRIIVDTVIGAAPPILYSIDNGAHFTTQNLFVNLVPGSYTILVQDANGCSTSVDAVVNAPELFQLSLDPQVILQLGDSYQINTQLSLPLSSVESINWIPATGLDCDTCLNPLASPLSTTLYRITVYSKAGCKETAPILLLVDKRADVYVPNIFSPDSDGENDVFTIYADPKSVKTIKSFQVFSRWGEMVYEYYNFDPNNPAYGWDGRHRGQELNPAVFGWSAVIEVIDGREVLYEGDVTLKR
ncbi:MAG: gliding motility-associated C-terminal domain-containing protein [Saprospiraceae bacterium]|nr:gliding motility-associated C-terminal domain-containing protein [Saprospiraceae bacterium]